LSYPSWLEGAPVASSQTLGVDGRKASETLLGQRSLMVGVVRDVRVQLYAKMGEDVSSGDPPAVGELAWCRGVKLSWRCVAMMSSFRSVHQL